MKTILHFSCEALVLKVPNFIIGTAHLVTFTVPSMNGEYEDRAIVYKNRAGNQNVCISLEQLRILQDCVLNNKPQPEFMKTNTQKAQEIADELIHKRLKKLEAALIPKDFSIDSPGLPISFRPFRERIKRITGILGYIPMAGDGDSAQLSICEALLKEKQEGKDNTISFYKVRLAKMEVDLFPSGYVDLPGLTYWNFLPIEVRFSRIERILGVVKSPGEISLARLENTEYHFYGITTRLGNLEIALFPTRKEIMEMKPVITLEGRFKRLEEKLGVNMAFTDLDHRLKHIEDAWQCTKAMTPYVCPVLKHQQALQDALQDAFGKQYKYQIGDTLEFTRNYGKYETKTITRVGVMYLFGDGVGECSDWVDKSESVRKVTQPVAWEG
jgi:hypothetical protein